MTQIQFNLDMDFLKESLMNSNIDNVVKSTIVLVLNEYMEKERDAYLKAGAYERSDERQDYRNGYYDRDYMLSIGKVKLCVPRTRSGEFSTTAFEKYRRCDQAFALSMLEMVVNGVSTRKVKNVVEQLCGEYVSKSFVSSLTEKLDPIVNEWANRSLGTEYYRYIYVDAMYIKVREHHKVVSKAVYIATGLNEGNKREVLGLKVSHEESYEAWNEFLRELIARGLQSPKLVISDAHSGLKKAIPKVFIGTSWQRCTVHFKKNLIDELPKKSMNDVKEELKQIFDVSTPEMARKRKDEFVSRYQDNSKLNKVIDNLENGFDDAIQYLNEPEEYQKFIRSTNSLERLNQEVRRRERVIRIFPNTQSAFRLIGAVLMDYEEEEQKKRPIFKRD
ncbi:IS256 family transposase [Virgibacillus sp. NKC19-16]|uniref:IS256 family transposase n=1 Tax=Virgibacillus salidurans TaxID=2831673 RepID=UPI001F472F76|nr:IS256 family transposase [Virgibacillus sp. NKC19-16]UJL48334.1 IS256 family transposase [Virgibacillus sp. NKC19-16]